MLELTLREFQFCHVAGAQVQVHLPAGVRLQRLRLLVHEEWEEEDVEQGRGEGHHAGPGEGPQHLLSQQRRDNSKLWIGCYSARTNYYTCFSIFLFILNRTRSFCTRKKCFIISLFETTQCNRGTCGQKQWAYNLRFPLQRAGWRPYLHHGLHSSRHCICSELLNFLFFFSTTNPFGNSIKLLGIFASNIHLLIDAW